MESRAKRPRTVCALQPFGISPYARILWTELVTYTAFVSYTTLALFVLTIFSLDMRFEKSNIVLKRLGHHAERRNDIGVDITSEQLDQRMEAHFVLLDALTFTSTTFQVVDANLTSFKFM